MSNRSDKKYNGRIQEVKHVGLETGQMEFVVKKMSMRDDR